MVLPAEPNLVWQKLKSGDLTPTAALALLVQPDGTVNLPLLNPDVSRRFFQKVPPSPQVPKVLPLLLWRNCYYLGICEPLTPEQVEFISNRTRTGIETIPIRPESYRQWYRQRHATTPHQITLAPLVNPWTGEPDRADVTEDAELYLGKADNSIHRINAMLAVALKHRASDIHLEPSREGLRVRFRIDGIMRPITTLPPHLSRPTVVATKVMAEMDIADSRRPHDGRIGKKYLKDGGGAQHLDLRVSTLPCVGGEKVVIRLLPQENPFTCLEDLGFSGSTLATYTRWLQQPQGLIILTGPTGSGKTSTLYTSLQRIATPEVNVTTVEDPVEYVLPHITQTQVHGRAGMTFAAGLRSILRQDPDIIMVGEIRDGETAETVVRAALTGHLVLTTMHTIDAATAIPRLRDLGPDPGLISDALLGVVGQRLVRKICPHCAAPYTPTSQELTWLGLTPEHPWAQNWQIGKGCDQCLGTGYLGRLAVVEVLNADDRIRQLVYGGTIGELRRYLMEIDFDSFRKDGIRKISQGLTTLPELRRVLPYSIHQCGEI
ncbi:GspE/PulE family protein [Gloeomargaritales cyanobacterium VI4D9]|nr:GspE/PulE family protein [Gloeomargaritales cyanobacterium VI4D9]